MEPGDPTKDSSPRSWLSRTPPVASEALRLADLPTTERRRAVLRCGATVVLAWVLLIGAFYVLPIGHESGLRAVVRLGVDIAVIGAVFAWQIRRISVAALPELRAIEALGIVIVLFLVLFSGIYLAMSHQSPSVFSQDARPHKGPLLHHHRLLDGRLRRHHAQDRRGAPGGRGPDAARPRHHRCRCPRHHQRGTEPDHPDRLRAGIHDGGITPRQGTKTKAASAQSPDDLRATTKSSAGLLA